VVLVGFKPYLKYQLVSFSALTLLVLVIWPIKSSQIWPIMCLVDVKPCSINQPPLRGNVIAGVCLSVCLSVSYQLHVKITDGIFSENFTRDISKDKEEIIKLWKSFTSGSGRLTTWKTAAAIYLCTTAPATPTVARFASLQAAVCLAQRAGVMYSWWCHRCTVR